MARRNPKSIGHQSAHVDDVVIPELDALLKSYKPKGVWTDRDRAVLREYWGRVPQAAIAKQLGKTPAAVKNQAHFLGLKVGDNRE